jgi:hypothetical protein
MNLHKKVYIKWCTNDEVSLSLLHQLYFSIIIINKRESYVGIPLKALMFVCVYIGSGLATG